MVISRVGESNSPMLPNEFNFSAKWVHNLFEIVPIHVQRESWKVDGPSNQFPSQCNSIRAFVLNPPILPRGQLNTRRAAAATEIPQYYMNCLFRDFLLCCCCCWLNSANNI